MRVRGLVPLIAVTGSVATDHLMQYDGRFVDAILPEQLERMSVSFLVDDLQIRRGGVGGNIAFGIAYLGGPSLLVGSVGQDIEDYRAWLERHGVDTHGLRVSDAAHTARFVCTTDRDENQIASFYAGAMSLAREIELAPIVEHAGGVDLVLVGPNDPVAMRRHTDECRSAGWPFAADPSQQLSSLSADEIVALVDGAAVLFCNDYELGLIGRATGWGADDLATRVERLVVTHGAKGSVIVAAGAEPLSVPAVPVAEVADPTGAGDAFRSGFLAGRHWRLDDLRCAQIGSTLAAFVLETVGTQDYSFTTEQFADRFIAAYGEQAWSDVAGHLRAYPSR